MQLLRRHLPATMPEHRALQYKQDMRSATISGWL
jgi:hypothetical protein